jgi:hypothetical protein
MIIGDTHGHAPPAERPQAFDPAHWSRMAPSEAKAFLRAHGCMVDQFETQNDGSLTWGSSFAFGVSPVPALAMAGDVQGLAQAFALGACPFARDLEDDGVFEYALRRLDSNDPLDRDCALRMAALAWEAGSALLDPLSPGGLPERGADWIRFNLASQAYSQGRAQALREAGVPVDPAWIEPFQREVNFVRQTMLGWTKEGAGVDALRELRDAGLDFLSPIGIGSETSESIWLWIYDDEANANDLALFLLESGNDPRVPLDGVVPLSAWREQAPLTAGFVESLLLAQAERAALDIETRPPHAARPKPAL